MPRGHFTNLLCIGRVIFGVGCEKWKLIIGVVISPLTEEISNVKSSVGEREEIITPSSTFVSVIMHNAQVLIIKISLVTVEEVLFGSFSNS